MQQKRIKYQISELINLFSLEEFLCLLYPRFGVSVPGVGHAAVLHTELLHPDGLPHPVEDLGVGHLGVHLGRPVLAVRQPVAADPDELLGVVPSHPVHAATAVAVTGGALTLEAHLGPPDLHPACCCCIQGGCGSRTRCLSARSSRNTWPSCCFPSPHGGPSLGPGFYNQIPNILTFPTKYLSYSATKITSGIVSPLYKLSSIETETQTDLSYLMKSH